MIGQETIDRVREVTPIVALVGESVKLQKRGRSFIGLCPFHKEKTPSFHVNEERGIYHCFGCGVTGDGIRFVQETEGLSFREAVERLAERAGLAVVDDASDEEQRRYGEQRRRQQQLLDVTAAAASYFERMLQEHPAAAWAKAELERRGLTGEAPTDPIAQALQAFRVGYAPYSWSHLTDHLRSAGLSLRAAEDVGLVVPRQRGPGHYDRFRHRLMFAVLDVQGRVIAFSGRSLPEPTVEDCHRLGLQGMGSPGAESPAKYVNSPESPIYRKREAVFGLHQARASLRQGVPCVLVEGNFDVVGLHARGLTQAVAPLGTAFTQEQAAQIRRFTQQLVLCFDADDAGRRAVLSAREACDKAGLVVRVATLPDGQDPDDVARSAGAEGLTRVLGAARGLLEHLIDTELDTTFAADDARARAAKIQRVVELVASETDPAVRAMAEQHADRIAERLGIADARTFRALARQVRAALQGPTSERTPAARPVHPETARCRDRRSEISLEILGAVLDYPQLLDTPLFVSGVEQLEGDVAAAVASLRLAYDNGSVNRTEPLLAKLAPSVHPFAAARLAVPGLMRIEDAEAVLGENFRKLDRLERQRQSAEVVEELHRAAATGDFEHQLELLREHMRRVR